MYSIKHVCVFCSSSNELDPAYYTHAQRLGRVLTQKNWGLVYGGTRVGIMGRLAQEVNQLQGEVTGVIPRHIFDKGIAYENCQQLIITSDMRERKKIMDERADAFVALPGGFGTLEEVLEVITLKQLQIHHKPIVFLNTNGFYDPFLAFAHQVYEQKFAASRYKSLYYIASDVEDLVAYLESYEPDHDVLDKWESEAVEKRSY